MAATSASSKTNYDLASNTYHTTWREPGINCETCHADGAAHIALYTKDLNAKHKDMRILRTTQFTVQQRNEMCAPCHAKMSPISSGYQVTQRFFDHYDLVTLEDPDYYPDGRDLGENYTYTSWLMNPCIRNGKFDCIHCHTSSGRYRFATENPNGACLPCHQEKAANVQAHTHHKPGTPGGQCIDCHMPKTRFANMNRSDHSMLPPTPGSHPQVQVPQRLQPLPHGQERSLGRRQSAPMAQAGLPEAGARTHRSHRCRPQGTVGETPGDPRLHPEPRRRQRHPGVSHPHPHAAVPTPANSLSSCKLSNTPNPLVRAAAAGSLSGSVTPDVRDALVRATADDYRLVRIRAAASLAVVPVDALAAAQQESVKKATDELIASYNARPDDFSNHTNLGNFYMERGQLDQSIQSFENAIRLRPDSVGTLVNTSMAYSRAGRNADAERVLDQALRAAPDNAPANFNRGLLLAEMGRKQEAEDSLRRALASDPNLAAAAFNLCVLEMERNDPAGFAHCRQAVKAAPQNEKYVFGLAFYLDQARQSRRSPGPARSLQPPPRWRPRHAHAPGRHLPEGRQNDPALAVYRAALDEPNIPPNQRKFIESRLRALDSR